MKYHINCKFCGALLLKTPQPLVAVLESEIKCPNCKRVVQLPEEVIVVPEKSRDVDKSTLIPKRDIV